MLLVIVVGFLALGVRWWWVEQQANATPIDVGEAWSGEPREGGPGEASSGRDDGQDPAALTAGLPEGSNPEGETGGRMPGAELMVHVIGQVHEPGVVQLPTGSRVVDAVEAAGGLTDQADAGSVNLARAVLDGEQVWVGAPGEEPPEGVVPASSAAGPSGVSDGGGALEQVPTDLNSATQAELEELPGVGPVTAERILAWRTENGRFTDPSELLEVSGIGERTLEQLAPLVRVGG